jgi:hypothetical protein
MNSSEAREILMLYRPGTADAEDPQIIEAMAVARQNPSLARWFDQHCAFQTAMRSKLRGVEVPLHLKAALRSGVKVVQPKNWWRTPAFLVPAAAVALLLTFAGVWAIKPSAPNRLANFETRMVGSARREYRMDIETNDMHTVREYLVSKGAPGDYGVTQGLQRLTLTGGGVLRWRNHPVSMVCFDRGDRQMLFLFVLDRSALKDPPKATPGISRLDDFVAVHWSKGNKTYILAGPEEPGFVDKYL